MNLQAKQIPLNPERTVDSLMAELKAHLTNEINGIKGLVQEQPLDAQKSAAHLGIHPNTFYIWIRQGTLPPEIIHRVGSMIFCYPSELNAFIKSRKS